MPDAIAMMPPSPNVIRPQLGDRLDYWPARLPNAAQRAMADIGDQPMGAIVTEVHSDRSVSVQVLDHAGEPWMRTAVTLVQPDAQFNPMGEYCQWTSAQVAALRNAQRLARIEKAAAC